MSRSSTDATVNFYSQPVVPYDDASLGTFHHHEFAKLSVQNSVARHSPWPAGLCQIMEYPEQLRSQTFPESHELAPWDNIYSHANPSLLPFGVNQEIFAKNAVTYSPQPVKLGHDDPYAASFLEEKLGKEKYAIFSGRLCDRKIGTRHKPTPHALSSVDYLIKTEVVKEVLRNYVPHPYNHLKSWRHDYKSAPSGFVTLTRATVLLLSGWSNTQFSYWARRTEALAVLKKYDARLQAVGTALENRLHANIFASSSATGGHDEIVSWGSYQAIQEQEDLNLDPSHIAITGKGLDHVIDAVKQKTGVSPFIRGKHSSLDSYISALADSEKVDRLEMSNLQQGVSVFAVTPSMEQRPAHNMPFQAEPYHHSFDSEPKCTFTSPPPSPPQSDLSLFSDISDPGSFFYGQPTSQNMPTMADMMQLDAEAPLNLAYSQLAMPLFVDAPIFRSKRTFATFNETDDLGYYEMPCKKARQ